MSLELSPLVRHGAGPAVDARRACAIARPLLRSLLPGSCATLLLLASLAWAIPASAAILETRPAASLDDAEESATGSMYYNSTDLELVYDGSNQTVGVRWPGLTIPQGATITAAWIQFTADESQSEATNLLLRAQAVDDAAAFSGYKFDLSSRATTLASATWAPVPWTSVGAAGADQRTPDLSALVQEVVNRPGWASGNALVMVITGTGHRTAVSWDGSATKAPLLHVEYTTGPPPPDAAPVAQLSVSVLPSPPLTVSASGANSTDTDATPIASYRFDFGDGTPAVVTNAPTSSTTHTYAAAGTYTVSLRVTDTGGLVSNTVTQSVTVNQVDAAPVAQLSVSVLPSPPLTVSASGANSTDTDATPIASYRFDFGDGTPAVVTNAPTSSTTHTYAATGTYTVSLRVTDTGGLVSNTVTQSVTVTDVVSTTTVDRMVSASTDDAEESATGKTSTTSSDLELIRDGSDQTVGMRWSGLGIPRGSTIVSAWIQFTAKVSDTGPTDLLFRGEASDNAIAFSNSTNNVSSRPRTSASTAWVPAPWASGQSGPDQRTPDLSAVVQEVVNRTGWAKDNGLVVIVTGSGRRTAYSYNGSRTRAPVLHVEYVAAPVPEAPPVASLDVTPAPSPPLSVIASGANSTDIDDTPIASYRFDFGDGTPAVVTNAPVSSATHTYAAAGTYTVTLIATDTGGLTSDPVSRTVTVNEPVAGAVAVYVGYYDTHHPDNPQPVPNPWMGDAGVVFVGTPDTPSGGWDSSALRLDNQTNSSLTALVTVDIGSHHYALWGSRTIPAGQKLILAQTAFENFDGSDTNPAGCYGCDPTLCLTQVQSTVPVVHVTIGGVTTDYYDPGQILNTHGVDAAGCPPTSGRNDESHNWVQVFESASAPAAIRVASERPGTDHAGSAWLAPPFPNPVRESVTLHFSVPSRARVHLALYDLAGRLIETALDTELAAGEYHKVMPLSRLTSGRYFCRLTTSQGTLLQSFVVTR